MIQISPYAPEPTISVLLPILNEERTIKRCLDAIRAQDYPTNKLEILVIDGGSTDETLELVQQCAERDSRMRLLANPERLQAHALNVGIAAANGEIIVRVDGHTLIAPDYVRQCVRLLHELADQGVVNVGGLMRPIGETPVGCAIAAAGSSAFGVPTAFHHSAQAQFVDTVYLGAWPRALFAQIGSFNPAVNVNEDYEFNFRTRQAGGKLYLSPDIHSTYFCRQTYRELARQYFRYGRQKVEMLRRYPTSLKIRHLAAPVFVATLVGLPILGLWASFFWLLWLLMIAVYVGASAYASKRASAKSGASLWRIMPAFGVMHIFWGAGFWRGWLTLPHK